MATAFDIGGAIETSPLFLVKRIRALIAGASPDIMLIAYRSSIFMPPPVGERGREGGGRRRGSKSLRDDCERRASILYIDRVLKRIEFAIGSYRTSRRLIETSELIGPCFFILFIFSDRIKNYSFNGWMNKLNLILDVCGFWNKFSHLIYMEDQ